MTGFDAPRAYHPRLGIARCIALEISGNLPFLFLWKTGRAGILTFIDKTEVIAEPKTARMEQRTKPHVKAEIQAAAALLGVDETTFVTSAAYAQALAAVEDHERTALTAQDRDTLLSALDASAEPAGALREAFDLQRQTVVNGG